MFYHSITIFFFNDEYIREAKRSAIFTQAGDRKKDKSVVSFTHEQNTIISRTQLDDIMHEQTNICWQLFASHVVGFRPMKRKNKLLGMIITIINVNWKQSTKIPFKTQSLHLHLRKQLMSLQFLRTD